MGLHLKFSAKDAKRLLILLIFIEVGMALIYGLHPMIPMPDMTYGLFDLNKEATIPAWFSSAQLNIIGLLFLFSASWPHREKIVMPGFLFFVGFGFIFLSMDETAIFHETIQATLRKVENIPAFRGNKGSWMGIYLLIALVFTVLGSRTAFSMWKVYPRQVLIIVAGFFLLILGAVGIEIIGYQLIPDATKEHLTYAEITPVIKLQILCEEFFEMAGASFILYGAILCAVWKKEPSS